MSSSALKTKPNQAPEFTVSFDFREHFLARSSTHPIRAALALGCEETQKIMAAGFDLGEKLKGDSSLLQDRVFQLVSRCEKPVRTHLIEVKRALSAWPPKRVSDKARTALAEFSGSFADLKPVIESIEKWNGAVAGYEAMETKAKAAFAKEADAVLSKVIGLVNEPYVREGIFFSSDKFYEGVSRFLKKAPRTCAEIRKNERQVLRSLSEHIARAFGKTTPRGTLAGVGAAGMAPPHRRVMLSLPVARLIARAVSDDAELWRFVKPRVNPTLFAEGEKYFFWKSTADGDQVKEALAAMKKDEGVDIFLKLAASRNLTAEQIVKAFLDELRGHGYDDVTGEFAGKFYKSLVGKQVLYGGLEIPFEERDGLAFVVGWLENVPASPRRDEILAALKKIQALVRSAADLNTELEARSKNLQDAAALIKNFIPEGGLSAEDSITDIFIADCSAPPPKGMDRNLEKVRALLRQAADVCYRMTAAAGLDLNANDLARDFLSRQGFVTSPRMEFPLTKVVADLDLPKNSSVKSADEAAQLPKARAKDAESKPRNKQDPFYQFLFNFIDEHEKRTGRRLHEVDLAAAGFLDKVGVQPMIDPFCAAEFNFMVTRSGEPLLVVESVANAGPGGVTRFVDLVESEKFKNDIQSYFKLLQKVVAPDKLWADCLYMTGEKVDTALWHENFADYVIELGVRSSKDAAHVIPLSEIVVKVEGTRAHLFWRKDGKDTEIHPSYESAVNMTYESVLDRFFRTMGRPIGPSILYWRNEANLWMIDGHAPRLRFGNVVLQRERWEVEDKDARPLADNDLWNLYKYWNEWRIKKGMPRHVFVSLHAKPSWWVDFGNPFSVEAFNCALANRGDELDVMIAEMLPTPEDIAADPDGRVCQFIAGALCQTKSS